MRYLALCSDYDGTIAHHGVVDADTIAALERLAASGRQLVLVTGRELDDLKRVFPRLDLFARVVAENGALLYTPGTQEEKLLADPPSQPLVNALRARAVDPLSVGRCIVATWEPHDKAVLDAIRELGLELHVIFNKGAVMILPSGINKATGLAAALEDMGLSPRNAVGVGDAENDHAFLSLCECSVAVANALPSLKEQSDVVTTRDHGAGVAELIDEMLADDLASRAARLARHRIALGTDAEGHTLTLDPYGTRVMVAGTSGGGKSTVAKGLLERIAEHGYSFCIIDPEGDYENLPGAVTLGTVQRAPGADEAMQLLERRQNAVLNLVGLPLEDRPGFFLSLLPHIAALQARTGQPHWLFLDETHHLLPATQQSVERALLEPLDTVGMISVHPEAIAPAALAGVNAAVVIGRDAADTLRRIGAATGQPIDTPVVEPPLETGEALAWALDGAPRPVRVRIHPTRMDHRRHHRKYAEGELPPDRSFWFRGPEGKLNLRAQNLIVFLQMADGVDDDTWLHHFRRGDVSRWIADDIKDESLAREVKRIEAMGDLSARESRALMRQAIEREYTLPA